MNFPEFPGSAFVFGITRLFYRKPGIFRRFPGEGFWGPRIAFRGRDEVDMLGTGEAHLYLNSSELFHAEMLGKVCKSIANVVAGMEVCVHEDGELKENSPPPPQKNKKKQIEAVSVLLQAMLCSCARTR